MNRAEFLVTGESYDDLLEAAHQRAKDFFGESRDYQIAMVATPLLEHLGRDPYVEMWQADIVVEERGLIV